MLPDRSLYRKKAVLFFRIQRILTISFMCKQSHCSIKHRKCDVFASVQRNIRTSLSRMKTAETVADPSLDADIRNLAAAVRNRSYCNSTERGLTNLYASCIIRSSKITGSSCKGEPRWIISKQENKSSISVQK